MNHISRLLLALLSCTSLAGCGDGTTRMHGHMESLEYEGQKCWIFVDDNHNKYEVITPSSQVLRDGVQMSIKAERSQSKTLCELPTVIDIVEYRYDFAKDN